jgi:GNAT superfamily N-acetyltransferase
MNSITIRIAQLSEAEQIRSLVNDVVQETYGYLHPPKLTALNDPNLWIKSWVALDDSIIVGVGLANDDCIDDLWIHSGYRKQGIGKALLSALETQINSDGFVKAKLRVVAENEAARKFYRREGWVELKSYPHEKWGFLMVDMQKELIG